MLRRHVAPVESAVVSRPNLDITGGALGSASGSATKSCPQSALRKIRRSHPDRKQFVVLWTKSVDNEVLHSQSQHSFLPCSPRNSFRRPLQIACLSFFNSRSRSRGTPFGPCAI